MLKSLPLLALSATALLAISACGEGDDPDTNQNRDQGSGCGLREDGQELFCIKEADKGTYLSNVAYGMIPPESSDSGGWEFMVYARNQGDEACPSDGAAPTDPFATIGPFQLNASNGRPLLHDDTAIELTHKGEMRRGTYADSNVLLGLDMNNPEMCTEDCYQQGGGLEFRVNAGITFDGEDLTTTEDAFYGSMNIPHCPELDHPGNGPG
ncbi:hypothetical protein DV096_12190 [Bradymonadaceae bacterium TMQ3]|nr:hypothetical protein DV096_12190 [Bradymonadaceae bacterium TMQ3]TXC75353.1 hypothetical protein FRC91_11570 [Bradymonadales bacterium TMQ1]